VVAGVNQPAPRRAKSPSPEKRSVDHARRHHSRLSAESDQPEVHGRKIAERRDRLHARLEVADLRHREEEVLRPDAERGLADVEQPVRVPIDERPQEHAPNDAEDRRVGADAEGESHDDGQSQPFGAGERSVGESQVGDEAHGVPDTVLNVVRRMSQLPGSGRFRPPVLDGSSGNSSAIRCWDTTTAGTTSYIEPPRNSLSDYGTRVPGSAPGGEVSGLGLRVLFEAITCAENSS